MPVMPKRACWADLVDESGDEMMAGTDDICKNEEDKQMLAGEVSPAASFCSTQFSWGDEVDSCQSAQSLKSDGVQTSMPSMEWEQTAMLPSIFAPYAVIPVVGVNVPNFPTHEVQCLSQSLGQCVSPGSIKSSGTDLVKKRFLKQGSQDRKRRPLASKQNIKELAPRTLPDASKEDWERRLQKRHNIVALIKETPEYQAFSAHRAGPRRAALRTPSPNDRSVSKRQWEDKVQKWRTALRNRHSNNAGK
mmetsp:Transcript_67707/g.128870  ORF Transcript_67707/g.128870 Transcript_67707/m.128870 type:complete len:248 (-) Transcript_67707:583-1326(-)